jgi:hypothetical protein
VSRLLLRCPLALAPNCGVTALTNRLAIGCGLRLALGADSVAPIRKSRRDTTLERLVNDQLMQQRQNAAAGWLLADIGV